MELALIVKDDNTHKKHNFKERLKRINLDRLQHYFNVWRVLEPKILARMDQCEDYDVSNIFAGLPVVSCQTARKGRFSLYFSQRDVAEIENYKLDFILRFGFGIIRGEILNCAKYGVWSFHHGDEMRFRGAPPGFWEIYHNSKVTGAILQKLNDRLDGGIVLRKGQFRTINTSYSANFDQILAESTRWPAQVCLDILSGVATYFDDPPSKSTAPIYLDPTNRQLIFFYIKLKRNYLVNLYKYFFKHRHWGLGLSPHPINSFLTESFDPQINFLPKPAKSHFHADPFGMICDDGTAILYEDCSNLDGLGSLGCVEVKKTLQQNTCQLNENYDCEKRSLDIQFMHHTSYPFIIRHAGETYCIPETASCNKVMLFKCTSPPHSWKHIADLIVDFPGVDSSVIEFEGKWWLFNTNNQDNPNANLYLWYAPSLEGPWAPHLNNPVKMDVSTARPAGTPFVHQGILYRPTQDCSNDYGSGVTIQRITEISSNTFEEEQVQDLGCIKKQYALDGMHTLSMAGECSVLDYYHYTFIPSTFNQRTKVYARKVLGKIGISTEF